MASFQAIGKALTKLNDRYADDRNRLYQEHSLECARLFRLYVVERQYIVKQYSEAIERAEWNHARKIEPLDYDWRADADVLDKDICIPHAPSLEDFEQERFTADADFLIARLNALYKRYQSERRALDDQYKADRGAAYEGYKSERDALENEGRENPLEKG